MSDFCEIPTMEEGPALETITETKLLHLASKQPFPPIISVADGHEIRGPQLDQQLLSSLPEYSVINLSGLPLLVKYREGYRKNFIDFWGCVAEDGQKTELKISARWKKLKKLNWPIAVWHGADKTVFKKTINTKKHMIFINLFLTDSVGYASNFAFKTNEGILGYAIPAADLSVEKGISANKMRIVGQPEYVSQDNFKRFKKKFFINLNHRLVYPISIELEAYLRALRLTYEKTAEKIMIPIAQVGLRKKRQGYETLSLPSGKAEKNLNIPQIWYGDLFPPETILFKNGVVKHIYPEKIPTP